MKSRPRYSRRNWNNTLDLYLLIVGLEESVGTDWIVKRYGPDCSGSPVTHKNQLLFVMDHSKDAALNHQPP